MIKDINDIQQNISNGNNTQENNTLLKDKKNKLEEINEKSKWIYSKGKSGIYRWRREKKTPNFWLIKKRKVQQQKQFQD